MSRLKLSTQNIENTFTMYMMTQKGDLCVKLFSCLSEVRQVSCMSPHLNILCTSSVKL